MISAEAFETVRELGRGGTAVVCLVKEKETGLLFAMKTAVNSEWEARALPQGASSGHKSELEAAAPTQEEPSARTLHAEAVLLSQVCHPGIPALYGELAEQDGFVMEYMAGTTLQKPLEEGEIFEVREAALAGVQLCEILQCLHAMEPPHIYRDLKPSNIIVREDGRIALVDFGTVRTFKEGAVEDTQHLGTEGYAAPEQYGGWEQSDARTDIYGIGAVLHSMVTGKPPLETGLCPIGEVIYGERGSRMEKTLMHCCSVSPNMRFSSCKELEKALLGVARQADKPKRKAGRRSRAAGRSKAAGISSAAARSDTAWRWFAASVWVSFGCFLACGMFATAASGARSLQYRRQIGEAAVTGDLSEKASAYREAVLLKPTETDAYMGFVDDVSADALITEEEMEAVDSVFYTRGCLEKMREERPGEYAWLEMEVGKRYFAFCEGGREPARQLWSNAAGTGGASGRVRKLSEVMCEVLGSDWTADTGGAGRAEAWQFVALEAVEEAWECGDGNFAAAVCGAAAGEAAVCADRYGESRAAEEMMREVTGRADQLLMAQERGEIEICGRLLEQLRTAVESATRSGYR